MKSTKAKVETQEKRSDEEGGDEAMTDLAPLP